MRNKTKDTLTTILLAVMLIGLWQIAATVKWIKPMYTGTPSEIVREFVWLFQSGTIWPHLFSSLQTFLVGFLSALIFAIILGVIIGSSERIYRITSPFIYTLQVIPKIVLLPLIIIWFGIGMSSRVALVFVMASIPMLITTIDGIRNIDRSLLNMARSFGASRTYLVTRISFFSALPEIISGVKLGLGRATIGMVISEYFGVSLGLGSLIAYYGASYQTNDLFAVIIVIVIWNLTMLKFMDKLNHKIMIGRQ